MRYPFALLALGWLALAGAAQAALFERPSLDLLAEARAAKAEGKQLAVFMTLPDCPGCLEMDRKVLGDARLERDFSRRYRSVRLDLAQTGRLVEPGGRVSTPAEFANRLRAFATPSFAFFDGDGQVRYRHTGTLDAAGLARLGTYVARADYERHPFSAPAPQAAAEARLHAQAPGATLPRQPEFQLAGSDGREHRLADFKGRAVALAVGYTQCPDVCPTTLAELKAAVEALPAGLRPQVQVLFATLDPERDNLALLKEYAAAFQPEGGRPLLALRGSPAQTAALVRQLQLVADKQPSASMGYTLDHTAGVFLFDDEGRLRGLSPYGQPVHHLSADLATLAGAAHASVLVRK
jgi:protein SCO1/2